MEYLADTANLHEIKELLYYFPLKGVTTNPTILKNEGKPLSVILPELIDVVGDKMLHFQMISTKAEDMVKEAVAYKAKYNLGNNFFPKIPVTGEGYRAITILKEKGFNVTATAIYTQQQALVAAIAVADYVAPYVNRLDNISSQGIDVVKNIVKSFYDYNLDTKVLAASFKTVDQVHRISVNGCHAATINFEILERLRSHPMTDSSVDLFVEHGKDIYDIEF